MRKKNNATIKYAVVGLAAFAIFALLYNSGGIINGLGASTLFCDISISPIGSEIRAIDCKTKEILIADTDASLVINQAIESGDKILIENGQYYLSNPILLDDNTVLYGESMDGVLLVDQTTEKLPQNTLFGSPIRNSKISYLALNQNANIAISDLSIKTNDNNVAITFGGVTQGSIKHVNIDLTRGYKGIDLEASQLVSIIDSTVTASPVPYWNYGIGTGLGGGSAYPNHDIVISRNTILGISGDSLIMNVGDQNVLISDNRVEAGLNTSTGNFDMFLDIQGTPDGFTPKSASKVEVIGNTFIAKVAASRANTGITIGGPTEEVVIRDNVFDATGLSLPGHVIGINYGCCTENPDGKITVENNRFLGIHIVFALGGSVESGYPWMPAVLKNYIIKNNYWQPVNADSAFLYATNNDNDLSRLNMEIVGNTVTGGRFVVNTQIPANAVIRDNTGYP